MSLDFLKNILGLNKEDGKKVESLYSKTVRMLKERNYLYRSVLSGNLLWRQHLTFKYIEVDAISPDGKIIGSYYEGRGIPYRSCPLSLLEDSPFGDHSGINLTWRASVKSYWSAMNRKIVKGGMYNVIGNKNVNLIIVDKVTRSNVYGLYCNEPVKVPKLQLGDQIA